MEVNKPRMFLADYLVNGCWKHNAHILQEFNMEASDEMIIKELDRAETEELGGNVKCAIAAELYGSLLSLDELTDIQEGRKQCKHEMRVIIPYIELFIEYMKEPPERSMYQ